MKIACIYGNNCFKVTTISKINLINFIKLIFFVFLDPFENYVGTWNFDLTNAPTRFHFPPGKAIEV